MVVSNIKEVPGALKFFILKNHNLKIDEYKLQLINNNAYTVDELRRYAMENKKLDVLKALSGFDGNSLVYYAEYCNFWWLKNKPDIRINFNELRKCPVCGRKTSVSRLEGCRIVVCCGRMCRFCSIVNNKD